MKVYELDANPPNLATVVKETTAGEDVVITEHSKPVARIVRIQDKPVSKGTPLEALIELRKIGGLQKKISDPVAWQREQRKDRKLPGRD